MFWIISHAGDLFTCVSYVVSAAAAIAALTPNTIDDGVIAKVRSVVDLLAFNFGYAKNVK